MRPGRQGAALPRVACRASRPGALLSVIALAASLCAAGGQDVDAWDGALRRHVSPGHRDGVRISVVDYAAMAADPGFAAFVASLESAEVSGLSRAATLALFINAYNALAIKMVVDHPCRNGALRSRSGPISSIKSIGVGESVWSLPAGKIGGRMYSLQQIEDYLRDPVPFGRDPRIHACIVCASISCPDVRREAYRAEVLDQQMADQMRAMLANPKKGLALDRKSHVLTLSPIFQWYQDDFEQTAESVLDFILPYLPSDSDRRWLTRHRDDIDYHFFQYNWNLIGAAPCNRRPADESKLFEVLDASQ